MVMMVMMTTAMHNRHGAYIKSCEISNFSARRLVVTVHRLSKLESSLFKDNVPAIASPLNSTKDHVFDHLLYAVVCIPGACRNSMRTPSALTPEHQRGQLKRKATFESKNCAPTYAYATALTYSHPH